MTPPDILVGTASFADRGLLATGRFYPPALPAAGRLPWYARHFPLVEVDATYYGLPDAQVTHGWALRTPEDFTINVKAFRALTGHPTPVRALPAELRATLDAAPQDIVLPDALPGPVLRELWQRFSVGIEPLRQAGRLGAVLCQLPGWVRADARGQAQVMACARGLEGHLPAIEFRHRSWFADARATARTLGLLRDIGAVHVVVDAPQVGERTVPAIWEATHPDVAMVRLHGRNAAAWAHGGARSSGRFDYVYSPQELAELADATRLLAARARRTHVVLNTNHADQGVVNAQAFTQALG